MQFIPFIGQTGTFELKAPYDTFITPRVLYTVRSIRTLNDILAAGENPYELFYKSVGIDKTIYDNDLNSNVVILGLQAGAGEWIYVPISYVTVAPNYSGVIYSSLVLGVSLGPIPDEYNLEGLKAEMVNLVKSALGVEPVVKAVMVAQPTMLTHEQHEQLENARAAKKTIFESTSAKLARIENELALERLKTKGLEKYIIEHR